MFLYRPMFDWYKKWQDVISSLFTRQEVGSSSVVYFDFLVSSDDAGESVRVPAVEGGEDDHLVGGAVRDRQLVAEPTKESFLRICQLFPPVCPVPRDLTETPVDPEPDGDGNDPYGIEQEDAGRHKYSVATGSLLIVIDEDVVPSDGPHVESIKSAEYPEERDENQRGEEDVKTPIEATQTARAALQIRLLLNLGQSVPVHPELNIKTFPFVLPVLDGAGDGEETVPTRLFHQT